MDSVKKKQNSVLHWSMLVFPYTSRCTIHLTRVPQSSDAATLLNISSPERGWRCQESVKTYKCRPPSVFGNVPGEFSEKQTLCVQDCIQYNPDRNPIMFSGKHIRRASYIFIFIFICIIHHIWSFRLEWPLSIFIDRTGVQVLQPFKHNTASFIYPPMLSAEPGPG